MNGDDDDDDVVYAFGETLSMTPLVTDPVHWDDIVIFWHWTWGFGFWRLFGMRLNLMVACMGNS